VFLLLAFLRKRWPMGFWKRLKMVAPKALRFAAKPKASGPLPGYKKGYLKVIGGQKS